MAYVFTKIRVGSEMRRGKTLDFSRLGRVVEGCYEGFAGR
jgi:hypothetical protein